MLQHEIQAVIILSNALRRVDDPYGAHLLTRAIRYVSNPDRYLRPKRGPANTKGGKWHGVQDSREV